MVRSTRYWRTTTRIKTTLRNGELSLNLISLPRLRKLKKQKKRSKTMNMKSKKKKLKRLFGAGGAVVFKGSGFYQTDYRSESYKNAAAADKPSESKSESKSDSKSDAKPAAKPETKSDSKPSKE